MKLNQIVIILSFFVCHSYTAQQWALRGSMGASMYTKHKVLSTQDMGAYVQTNDEIHTPTMGGNLGVTIDFKLGSKVTLRTGTNFNYMGTNFKNYYSVDYNSIDYWYTEYKFIETRIFSIGIPLLITIPLHTGKTKKYILVGGEMNTNIIGQYQMDRVYISEHVLYNEQDDANFIQFGNKYDDDMKRLNFMVNAGFGIEHKQFQYELIFSHGLNNMINLNADPFETFHHINSRNWRQIFIGFSVGFNLKK